MMMKCRTFEGKPSLLEEPYHVLTPVKAKIFNLFVRAILGTNRIITPDNATVLERLCD
jgi:hypothetical protein